jgi:hypothetical protein
MIWVFLLFHWFFQPALLDLYYSNQRFGLVVDASGLLTSHRHNKGGDRPGEIKGFNGPY